METVTSLWGHEERDSGWWQRVTLDVRPHWELASLPRGHPFTVYFTAHRQNKMVSASDCWGCISGRFFPVLITRQPVCSISHFLSTACKFAQVSDTWVGNRVDYLHPVSRPGSRRAPSSPDASGGDRDHGFLVGTCASPAVETALLSNEVKLVNANSPTFIFAKHWLLHRACIASEVADGRYRTWSRNTGTDYISVVLLSEMGFGNF